MKITDIIKTERSGKNYRAMDCRGSTEVWRDSPEQAKRALGGIMVDQLFFATPEYRYANDGTLYVFRYNRGSWVYDIVRKVNNRPSVSTTVLSDKFDRFESWSHMCDHIDNYNSMISE